MSWLEIKYLERMRFQLDQYEQVSSTPFVANFKCPLCGDSKRRKHKKRAYVYEKDNSLLYYCHNCGASMAFFNFLQMRNPQLYGDYKLEWLNSMGYIKPPKNDDEPRFQTHVKFDKTLKLGTKLIDCPDDDCVLKYAKERMIPERFWASLYSCSNMQTIIKQIPRYENTKIEPEPSLVIPFFDNERSFSYLSSRSIDSGSSFRYLVLEIDDKLPKLWGLETVDWSQPIYVFEGPFDAMWVSNGLALAGSVGIGAIDYIMKRINKRCDVCFVYDNEIFSNQQINKQVQKRIKEGFSVVLYDQSFKGKDANEVICNGSMTPDEVYKYLQNHSFNGLRAKLEMARQKKHLR